MASRFFFVFHCKSSLRFIVVLLYHTYAQFVNRFYKKCSFYFCLIIAFQKRKPAHGALLSNPPLRAPKEDEILLKSTTRKVLTNGVRSGILLKIKKILIRYRDIGRFRIYLHLGGLRLFEYALPMSVRYFLYPKGADYGKDVFPRKHDSPRFLCRFDSRRQIYCCSRFLRCACAFS